jgi:hypothetical protein
MENYSKFAKSLVEDAVRFTPGPHTPEMFSTLAKCMWTALLGSTAKDLQAVRKALVAGGWNVTPPPKGKSLEDSTT